MAFVLVAGPVDAAPPPSAWPRVGADAGGSYFNPHEHVVNSSTVGRLRLRWKVPPVRSNCPGLIGPVVAGGLTLTQDTSGLVARSSATGRAVWRETSVFANRRAYHLVVSGSTVVVTSSDSWCMTDGGDADGLVVAFDLATGRQRWRRSPNTDAAQVVVVRGMVVVSGNDYGTEPSVMAYRLTDGKNVWSRGDGSDAAYTLFSAIPVGGDVLVSHHGEPSRVDAVTGRVTGSWPAAWTPLTGYGDWLFVGDNADWSLKAFHPSTGKLAWSTDRVSNRIATDGRRLYFGIGNSLRAYEIRTGRRVWSVNLGGRAGQPVRAADLVYAPVAGRSVAVRRASTGAKVNGLSGVSSIAAVAGGQLFSSGSGGLAAYGPVG